MVYEYKKRRDFMIDRLNRIEGIMAARPDGAFYVFANVSKLYSDSIKRVAGFLQNYWRMPMWQPSQDLPLVTIATFA